MKEPAFLKKNAEKWRAFESLMKSPQKQDPDKLAELFIEVTDDLSFARTLYPKSKTTAYLNGLGSRVHQNIYKNKKEKQNRIWKFWAYELPLEFRKSHSEFLYSFLIFTIACLVGAVSAAYDDTFVRLIMGDDYVNMTLDNIRKGDPMAVYKGRYQSVMFLQITLNNIMVSFNAFTLGIFLPSIGTVRVLVGNGIMLGSFQYFFHDYGLLYTSFTTIWIHGALEISAIVIAGGAGLTVGNSILFPKTYGRMTSFRKGAKRGMKIVIGLVPIFIMAGFIESFITRLTEMPDSIKWFIILGSFSFVIYYFVVYPIILSKRVAEEEAEIEEQKTRASFEFGI